MFAMVSSFKVKRISSVSPSVALCTAVARARHQAAEDRGTGTEYLYLTPLPIALPFLPFLIAVIANNPLNSAW